MIQQQKSPDSPGRVIWGGVVVCAKLRVAAGGEAMVRSDPRVLPDPVEDVGLLLGGVVVDPESVVAAVRDHSELGVGDRGGGAFGVPQGEEFGPAVHHHGGAGGVGEGRVGDHLGLESVDAYAGLPWLTMMTSGSVERRGLG